MAGLIILAGSGKMMPSAVGAPYDAVMTGSYYGIMNGYLGTMQVVSW